MLLEGDASNGQCSLQVASKMAQMPGIMSPVPLNLGTALPLLEPAMGKETRLSNNPLPPLLSFDHLPHPMIDLPLLQEDAHQLLPSFRDVSFQDEFACLEPCQCMPPPDQGLPFCGLDAGQHGITKVDEYLGTPDFFEDLPTDMFDYLEPPPPPPPPPASSTSW